MKTENSRDILVCGYSDFSENPDGKNFQFVPANLVLDPLTGAIKGTHTPIYNPLIDVELDRIFIGHSIYAGMDFYVRQIEAAMHFPSIRLLIKALYDLYENFLNVMSRYWAHIRIQAVDIEAERLVRTHYDYFCGSTYLSHRLNSTLSDRMEVFVKVKESSQTIEDCWISKFSAFPDDSLRELFIGYSLDTDPKEVTARIDTYYRITANKAIANVFMDVVKNCREYYSGQTQ